MSSMTNEISRDEMRSSIEDKLCAHFGVTALDEIGRASCRERV